MTRKTTVDAAAEATMTISTVRFAAVASSPATELSLIRLAADIVVSCSEVVSCTTGSEKNIDVMAEVVVVEFDEVVVPVEVLQGSTWSA